MGRRRHKRTAYSEHSYWQSYSDMMAALLLIFILIIAITLMIYRQKTMDLDVTREELSFASEELENARIDLENYRQEIEASNKELEESKKELEDSYAMLQEAYDKVALTSEELAAAYLEIDRANLEIQAANQELANTKSELQDIVGIRTDIIGELQSKFNNSSMSVDPQNGSITFSADVLFSVNSTSLNSASRETLREVIPMYLGVLLQDNYREYIAEIIIEGHTDTNGGYQHNMQLSAGRAQSVAKFCMDTDNGLSEEEVGKLQSVLTVNGRASSDPIYKEGTTEVDMAASRRVEIKFRLKEDEMIQKIAEVLGGM
ncbi:MAG: OmpA family protein [Lachnospiraceae bacterium]|nr:OmpA family protein [Lachnospiraceae bacterium]